MRAGYHVTSPQPATPTPTPTPTLTNPPLSELLRFTMRCLSLSRTPELRYQKANRKTKQINK